MNNVPLIEVKVVCGGHVVRAEAETAEGAIFAARTLFDEAFGRWGGAFRPTIWFHLPDGRAYSLKAGRKP